MTEGGGMLKSWTKSDRFEAIPGGICSEMTFNKLKRRIKR